MSAAPDYSRFESCLDVSDADIAEALAPAQSLNEPTPRRKTLALLEHMAGVAQPRKGAPRILVLAANMAMHDWLDGDLVVKLIGDDEVTVLELLVDDGLSRERIAGPLRIDVSLAEFRNAVNIKPELIRPLAPEGKVEARRLVLRSSRDLVGDAAPPSFSAFASGLMRAVSGKALGSQRFQAVRAPIRVEPEPPKPKPTAPRPKPPRPAPPRAAEIPVAKPPPPKRKKSIASFERASRPIEFPEQYRRSKAPDEPSYVDVDDDDIEEVD